MLYQDTDCVKMLECDLPMLGESFGRLVNHWPELEDIEPLYKTHRIYEKGSKIFGSFENELPDNNISIILGKKMWFSGMKNTQDKISDAKYKFKGLPLRAIYLDKSDPRQANLITTRVKNTVKGPIYEDKVDQNAIVEFLVDCEDKGIDCSLNNPQIAFTVFKDLAEEKSCQFITSQFEKVIKSGLRLDVCNEIRIEHRIKEIRCIKKEN